MCRILSTALKLQSSSGINLICWLLFMNVENQNGHSCEYIGIQVLCHTTVCTTVWCGQQGRALRTDCPIHFYPILLLPRLVQSSAIVQPLTACSPPNRPVTPSPTPPRSPSPAPPITPCPSPPRHSIVKPLYDSTDSSTAGSRYVPPLRRGAP